MRDLRKTLLPKLKLMAPGHLTLEEHEWLSGEALKLEEIRQIMESPDKTDSEKFNQIYGVFSAEEDVKEWTSNLEKYLDTSG